MRPRLSRSAPASAIIAALSVHQRRGGAKNSKPRERASASRRNRRTRLAATPPARTKLFRAATPFMSAIARADLMARISATASWNDAQISAVRCTSGSRSPIARRTAVFSPEKLISRPGLSRSGRGRMMAAASPSFAARSTAGPPCPTSRSILAVLSKASPTASSMVEPRRR